MPNTPAAVERPLLPASVLAVLKNKEFGILLLLVALGVVVSVKNPQFLTGANLQNMARLIGAYSSTLI
jgi:ribose/xylose/arabinose/galactoside ABC-type transport system permease subunit